MSDLTNVNVRYISYIFGEIDLGNQAVGYEWHTTLSRKGGHSIYIHYSPVKPTKRQLRKWMKEVKMSDTRIN